MLDALAEERWEVCPGFQRYCVSTEGRIRRDTDYDTKGRRQPRRILKPRVDAQGYAHVCLHDGPRSKTYRVHTLVLTTFVGPADGQEANHKDGNRGNNALTNLEWLTHAENIRATYAAGRGAQQKPGYLNPMRAEAREARAR